MAPFRGLRPTTTGPELASRVCPPYDVIDAAQREALLSANSANAVAVILPEATPAGYARAADTLQAWVTDGLLAVDDAPALYVYELEDPHGQVTRGLLGAVELRDPADGVILPHENTMAGPVADRLAVMTATDTDLEPIYLVYDGGGAASQLVAAAGELPPLAEATTADGTTHRLWQVTDRAEHDAVAADLTGRSALIADGHHRYATYRERQRIRTAEAGSAGPWDRGLALLVDTSEYGPQVHPIHRTVSNLDLRRALAAVNDIARATPLRTLESAVSALADAEEFAVVLTDGAEYHLITDDHGALAAAAVRPGTDPVLSGLDVTVLHRGLVERVWGLSDDVDTVGYAHDVAEAITLAGRVHGIAVLVRATPVGDVAAVAAAGARMPRKSTLFTPKPASGLVMRRLVDQT